MAKLVERHGVMEDFDARTKSRLVDMIFNPDVAEDGSSIIKITDVDVNRITPRSINAYSQGRIERLAKSIRNTNNRLIHPIVLVRASDLPEDGEVIQGFIKKGVDPKTLDLVIVAGERRFRAWLLLREEEAERIKGEVGTVNRFDKIPANILSKKEAAREAAYYKDSNNEARQLTSTEAMIHTMDALAEVDSPEKKREALVEMAAAGYYGGEIPEDPEKAARLFNEQAYIKYYIQDEICIDSMTDASIKRYHAIVKRCIPEVTNAVSDLKIKPTNAEVLHNESKDVQRQAIEILERQGKDAFLARIKVLEANQEKERARRKRNKESKVTSAQIFKKIGETGRRLSLEKEEIEEMTSYIGGENRADCEKMIKKYNKWIKEIEEFVEQHR